MKKQDLKMVYSNVPTDFHNSVVRTLNGLEEKQGNAIKTKSKVLRIAVVCALVVAIGAVGVVSAAAIYPMVVNREGNYGMNISFEAVGDNSSQGSSNKMTVDLDVSTKNIPEYVKMNIGYLPDGVIKDQGKYSLNGEHNEKCFTFVVERVAEDVTVTDDNIIDYEQFEIDGNMAVLANVNNVSNEYTRRFFIYFEEYGVYVKCYVTSDVTDDELRMVMENISFTEGTAEDCSGGSLSAAKKSLLEKAEEAFDEFCQSQYDAYIEANQNVTFTEISLGQTVGFSDEFTKAMTENNYCVDYTIDSIEVMDNISGLDKDNFNLGMIDLSEYADENGNLVPYTREVYSDGDGINTVKELISSEQVNRKLIYITVTATNNTNKEQSFYMPQISLDELRENDGKLEVVSNLPSYKYMREISYIDNNNVDKFGFKSGYNALGIPANSSEVIHLGFFVDEDTLDELYVSLNATFSSGIFDADTNTFVHNSKQGMDYGFACIKVISGECDE